MNSKKIACFIAGGVLSSAFAYSDVTISDFSNGAISGATYFNTWIGALAENETYVSFVSPATDYGNFVSFQSYSLSGLNYVSVTAKIDSGNTATGFSVILYSSETDVAVANFSTSSFSTGSFTTVTAVLNTSGAYDASAVLGWGISGGAPASSTVFRYSFDNLAATSAIPEPSTYGLILGGVALGLVGGRRRRPLAA